MTPQDIAIIACTRLPTPTDNRRVIGVRWASRPDLGFPLRGYIILRRIEGAPASVTVGIFTLPSTTSWAAFEADAMARRPLRGPYFDTFEAENLAYLLPIVRLADPRTPTDEHKALTLAFAEFFGGTHADDAELAWTLWPGATPPPIQQLLSDAVSAPPVISFYQRRAWDYLQALAMRFEYAVLFGLGTDDAPPTQAPVTYQVDAVWKEGRGLATSDPQRTNSACSLAPPTGFIAERAPGTVAHPAFAAVPAWNPPLGFVPLDGDGQPMDAEALVPRSPCAFTALTWAAAPVEPTVIGHGPILYRLARFDHGRHTAASTTEPPLPPAAAFVPLVKGEDLLRSSSEPNFLDLPGMAWPPLEGHYRYSLHAVSLLGVVSNTAAQAGIRHHDDIAPAAPRARALDGPAMELAVDNGVTVPLRIEWDAAEDFASPDVTEFRVAVSWTPMTTTNVHVVGVAPVDALHVDVSVASLAGAANTLAGSRLSLPNGEFPIVSHDTGAPATMRVRRVAGRVPETGAHGVVFASGDATPRTRVLRVPRRPAVPASVSSVESIEPADITLTAATPLPVGEPVRIYLHLFRATFDADPLGGARWRVRPPGEDHPANEIWNTWIGHADPHGVLADSPAIVFPAHQADVQAAAPSQFTAGLLEISVSAADATTYVSSPALPASDPSLIGLRGNESAMARVPLSIRSPFPPDGPAVGDWDGQRLWAASAAIYKEGAEFLVAWTVVAGAVRYEVWRALDEGLPGASSASTDQARRAIADANPEAFTLRSGLLFGTDYRDELPGRAPTRAYYRVRAIGANGVASVMSGVIGPVYVPDIRRPATPNLLRVNALLPEVHDRAVALEWTQAGDLGGAHFEVECRARGAAAFSVVGQVTPGVVPGAAGVFRFVHDDRVPGKVYEYRVVAHRVVPDPIDPSGVTMRSIASAPSNMQSVKAVSLAGLRPPDAVVATLDPLTDSVIIDWTNADPYESISIRRRAAGKHVYQLVATIAGDAVTFTEEAPATGTWRYQVRAHGVGTDVRSVDAKVEVP